MFGDITYGSRCAFHTHVLHPLSHGLAKQRNSRIRGFATYSSRQLPITTFPSSPQQCQIHLRVSILRYVAPLFHHHDILRNPRLHLQFEQTILHCVWGVPPASIVEEPRLRWNCDAHSTSRPKQTWGFNQERLPAPAYCGNVRETTSITSVTGSQLETACYPDKPVFCSQMETTKLVIWTKSLDSYTIVAPPRPC
jgi:hypothetical protein